MPENNLPDGGTEMVCPWCQYRHHDSWEYSSDIVHCGECDKPFVVCRVQQATRYYCRKPKEPSDAKQQ